MLVSRDLYEHSKGILEYQEDVNPYSNIEPYFFYDKKGNKQYCFSIVGKEIHASYYVGVDWLIDDKEYIYIAPKINTKGVELFEDVTASGDLGLPEDNNMIFRNHKADCYKELNYLKMFMDSVSHPEVARYAEGVLHIKWDSPYVRLENKVQDLLTPLLIIQYLNVLKSIVRKGLKKSYYKDVVSLQGRVKGKILVAQNIKNNVVRNRLANTVCQYQEFGIDNLENRFLKKVLKFISNYMANNSGVFKGMELSLGQIIGFCSSALEAVSENCDEHDLQNVKVNSFFKEYAEAVKIGKQILRRFAYSISNVSEEVVLIPPFWIDMPRLFELYVYRKLLDIYPITDIHYHFGTKGNELDFLITKRNRPMIIDAKYKLHYEKGHIHEDIRQVAGYARLKKVYDELGADFKDKIIDCLIVYPKEVGLSNTFSMDLMKPIDMYDKVYKLALDLP